MVSVNLLAVFVAAVIAFVIGFLFHGPFFGKLWMKLANITPTGNEKFKDMIPQMLWNLLAQLVTAYVLAVMYAVAAGSSVWYGASMATALLCAFWLWLGFLAAPSSMEVIWMGRSAKLWLFECVCGLVTVAAMAGVLVSMQ